MFEGPISVSPAVAREWLDTKGRAADMKALEQPYAQQFIKQYAAQFVDGSWICRPDMFITFGKDGTITSGHKRLAACVAAGVPFQTYISREGE